MVTLTAAVESTMWFPITGPETYFTVQKSTQTSFNATVGSPNSADTQSCFLSCQVLLEDMDLPVEIVTKSSSSGHPRSPSTWPSRKKVADPESVDFRTPQWAKCKHSVPPLKEPPSTPPATSLVPCPPGFGDCRFATRSSRSGYVSFLRIRASSRKET